MNSLTLSICNKKQSGLSRRKGRKLCPYFHTCLFSFLSSWHLSEWLGGLGDRVEGILVLLHRDDFCLMVE